MSALLRNPAVVPSLFSRSVDEDAPPIRPAGGWRAALRIARGPDIPAGLLAAGAGLIAALIDVPLVQAASRIAAATLSG